MKILLDTHTHTIASGHWTKDTVTDLAKAAARRGLELLAVTDHSPSVPGAATENYFRALRHTPRNRCGVQLLFGVEADVVNAHGKLGLSDALLAEMEIVIVSQHPPCFPPASAEENTAALLAAVRSGRVDIVGHPDDEKYPLHAEELVRACAEHGTMIEMNEASLRPGGYRGNAKARDAELLALCRRHDVYVALGSDSHGAAHVGEFTFGTALLRETGFPAELVVNDRPELFQSILLAHAARRRAGCPFEKN